jgi:hypothetical protein
MHSSTLPSAAALEVGKNTDDETKACGADRTRYRNLRGSIPHAHADEKYPD